MNRTYAPTFTTTPINATTPDDASQLNTTVMAIITAWLMFGIIIITWIIMLIHTWFLRRNAWKLSENQRKLYSDKSTVEYMREKYSFGKSIDIIPTIQKQYQYILGAQQSELPQYIQSVEDVSKSQEVNIQISTTNIVYGNILKILTKNTWVPLSITRWSEFGLGPGATSTIKSEISWLSEKMYKFFNRLDRRLVRIDRTDSDEVIRFAKYKMSSKYENQILAASNLQNVKKASLTEIGILILMLSLLIILTLTTSLLL